VSPCSEVSCHRPVAPEVCRRWFPWVRGGLVVWRKPRGDALEGLRKGVRVCCLRERGGGGGYGSASLRLRALGNEIRPSWRDSSWYGPGTSASCVFVPSSRIHEGEIYPALA
jgi:hypothetical protein